MKSSVVMAAGLLGAAAFLTGQAQAGTISINFDDLAAGAVVMNQYGSVIFTADSSHAVETTAQGISSLYHTSTPSNLICTVVVIGGAIDCAGDIILTFSTPVDNLTFDAFGNQTPAIGTTFPGMNPSDGIFARVDVYQNGVLTQPNIGLVVTHTQAQDDAAGCVVEDCLPDPQSLLFTGITKVVIHSNTDNAGTAYDNFSFTPQDAPPTDPTPEPSTLLATGLCLVWAGRRSLARKNV